MKQQPKPVTSLEVSRVYCFREKKQLHKSNSQGAFGNELTHGGRALKDFVPQGKETTDCTIASCTRLAAHKTGVCPLESCELAGISSLSMSSCTAPLFPLAAVERGDCQPRSCRLAAIFPRSASSRTTDLCPSLAVNESGDV